MSLLCEEGSSAGLWGCHHAAHAWLSCGSRCLQQDRSIPGAGTRCSLTPGGSAEATVTPVAPSQGCLPMAEAVHSPALLRLRSSHEQREARQAMAGPWRGDEGDAGSRPRPRDTWGGQGSVPSDVVATSSMTEVPRGRVRGRDPSAMPARY